MRGSRMKRWVPFYGARASMRRISHDSARKFEAPPLRLTAAKKPRSEEQKRIKDLERALKRKEAALAETAALLVLRKKPVPSGGKRAKTHDHRDGLPARWSPRKASTVTRAGARDAR
jgi:hypothetical protein